MSSVFATPQAQPGTVIAAWSLTNAVSAGVNPGIYASANINLAWRMWYTGSTPTLNMAADAGLQIQWPVGGAHAALITTVIYDGASSLFRLAGANSSGTTSAGSIADIVLGRDPNVSGTNYLTGAICEVLYFSGHLTSTQYNAYEAYLHAKWSIP